MVAAQLPGPRAEVREPGTPDRQQGEPARRDRPSHGGAGEDPWSAQGRQAACEGPEGRAVRGRRRVEGRQVAGADRDPQGGLRAPAPVARWPCCARGVESNTETLMADD